MAAFPVVLDASVLFNAPVRDTLLRAAELGLYRVHWSQEILDETIKNLIGSGKMTSVQAERFVAELAKAFPEAMVAVPPEQTAAMRNHPKDRHIAACAVCANAQVISTFNLKDFPADTLSDWNVEAQHPDIQLCFLFQLASDMMLTILIQQAADLEDVTLDQLLDILKKHVPRFVGHVTRRLDQSSS
jgi:polyhydroxyalkanoate synthesis regulator phasin